MLVVSFNMSDFAATEKFGVTTIKPLHKRDIKRDLASLPVNPPCLIVIPLKNAKRECARQ